MRKLLVVAGREQAGAFVRDIREMKDYSYELTGIVLLDGADASGEAEGVASSASEEFLPDQAQRCNRNGCKEPDCRTWR